MDERETIKKNKREKELLRRDEVGGLKTNYPARKYKRKEQELKMIDFTSYHGHIVYFKTREALVDYEVCRYVFI